MLVDKTTGTYVYACQWNGQNRKKLIHAISGDPIDDFDFDVDKNNHMVVSVEKFENGNELTGKMYHHKLADVPKGSFLVQYSAGNMPLKVFTPDNFKKCFELPHVIKNDDVVSKKTGKHYHSYKWLGSWSNIPYDMYGLMLDNYKYSIDTNKVLHIINTDTNKSIVVQLKGYILLDVGVNNNFHMYSVTNEQYQHTFIKAHAIKLPRYVFVVVAVSDDTYDNSSQEVTIRSTYKESQKVANRLEHKDGGDFHRNSNIDYIVEEVPTSKILKADI